MMSYGKMTEAADAAVERANQFMKQAQALSEEAARLRALAGAEYEVASMLRDVARDLPVGVAEVDPESGGIGGGV